MKLKKLKKIVGMIVIFSVLQIAIGLVNANPQGPNVINISSSGRNLSKKPFGVKA